MQNEKMSESKSVGPISMLLLPSPALLLAEAEAQIKAKAPRLRAQQRGRVAVGQGGALKGYLRYLRSIWPEVCRPALRSHSPSKVHRAAPARGRERSGEFGGSMRQLPPQEKKG